MRVLVFGATGFTGRAVADAALAAGHRVSAFVRDPAAVGIRHERLEVVRGDSTDAASVLDAVGGQDAVIQCLGPGGSGGRGDGRPTTIVSDSTLLIVAAMEHTGARRLVAMSNVGAGTSAHQGSWAYRRLLRPVVMNVFLRWLAPIIDDMNRMEPVITGSTLDYTIARFPNIVDKPARGTTRTSSGPSAVSLSITGVDAAEFLVASLGDPELRRIAISVST